MTMSDSDGESMSNDEFPRADHKAHSKSNTRNKHEYLVITDGFKLPTDVKDEYTSDLNPAITADQIDAFKTLEPAVDKDIHVITIAGDRCRDRSIEIELIMGTR